MIKNSRIQYIFFITLLVLPVIADALAPIKIDNPEFVFGIIASKRGRAELIDHVESQNILAYNINSESEIDLDNNCINKVWRRAGGQWVRVDSVPLPDVIYDFGVNKNSRQRKNKIVAIKALLKTRNIPFINPEDDMNVVNDKVLFADVMHQNSIPHPLTLNYSKTNLKKLLKKHDILFIKPIKGSKGYGIIVVEKLSNSKKPLFRLRYKKQYRGQWATVYSEHLRKKDLYGAIAEAQKHLRRGHASYLIQEGIDAYRYKGKQTDFRVNTQRGVNGEITSTAVSMRVGGNVSQGGRPADCTSVLTNDWDNANVLAIKNRVVSTALLAHQALEKYAGKPIGDLGMDLVIDEKGNPIIIEANSKNGWVMVHMKRSPELDTMYDLPAFSPHGQDIDAQHMIVLLAYARHLVAQHRL